MGYELGDNALEDAFNRFKALADRKKARLDEESRRWRRGDRHPQDA